MATTHIELNNQITVLKENGFYNLAKDKEAVVAFEQEIIEKLVPFDSIEERIRYMIDNDFYYDVYQQYQEADVAYLHRYCEKYNFKFESYMAISKFYKDYALKTDDKKKYLETYADRVSIVALYLGRGDFKKAKRFASAMMEQRYQPATPTFLNAGRSRRGEMVSCFLLEMDDSLNSINFNISTSMQLSKIGGGVALNLSKVRGRNESIKGIENAASGIMPVMKLLEDAFSYANQLGQRKGAGAAYLNIFHWDVVEFLDSKKINADEKSRIKTLSIGLIVPNIFFDLAERDEDFYVFAPHTVYKEYGIHLDDMDIDNMYYTLLANPNVKKRKLDTNARAMITKIAMTQFESGYPYLMYKSNANNMHALKNIGQVKMSNLCTEIFQLQETSTINDYGTPDVIRRDINCNLGSVNIVNVMESKKFRDTIHVGMDALTAVSDMTTIENAPTVRLANEQLHAVGLGMMNLHGFLAKNKIHYESKYARDFARSFAAAMNFYSIERSMEIAREQNETFKDFDKSDYATGEYFTKYLKTDYRPKSKKVQALFEGIELPSPSDWDRLMKDVRKYGMYHAYRLAIAPTQSISYVQNSTSSIMPVVEHIESRTYANATTYYPMPYLSEETYLYYKSAYDMDMFALMDMVSVIQEHVDQGISTILYVKSSASTRELGRYYTYAAKIGLKSLYYTRTKNENNMEECIACAV